MSLFGKLSVGAVAVLCVASSAFCAPEIDPRISDDVPELYNGNPNVTQAWLKLFAHTYLETQCTDLKPIAVCGPDAILWSFRLPVTMVESTPNGGETQYSAPYSGRKELYNAWQEAWYSVAAAHAGSSAISTADTAKRRTGTRAEGPLLREAHLRHLDEDFTPLVIQEVLPEYCYDHYHGEDEYGDYDTDLYLQQLYWRKPEYTESVKPGSNSITALDCAAADRAQGKLNSPALKPLLGILKFSGGAAAAVANDICMWGGKTHPLNGHNYSRSPDQIGALNTLKAIELAPYANSVGFGGTETHSFDDAVDVIQRHYPEKSGCIKKGDDPKEWDNGGPQLSDHEHTVFIHWKYRLCCAAL